MNELTRNEAGDMLIDGETKEPSQTPELNFKETLMYNLTAGLFVREKVTRVFQEIDFEYEYPGKKRWIEYLDQAIARADAKVRLLKKFKAETVHLAENAIVKESTDEEARAEQRRDQKRSITDDG